MLKGVSVRGLPTFTHCRLSHTHFLSSYFNGFIYLLSSILELILSSSCLEKPLHVYCKLLSYLKIGFD